MKSDAEVFKFRKNSTIGANAAENDLQYLDTCFVNTGLLDILLNPEDPRQIIVGRTGSGKTALIRKVSEKQDYIIEISPHLMAFEPIISSRGIQQLNEAGFILDPLFKMLWKNIFVVELLKTVIGIRKKEDQKQNIREKITRFFHKDNRVTEQIIEDHQFLLNVSESISEITKTAETKIEAGIKGIIGNDLSLNGIKKWTEEQKYDINRLGSDLIDKIKIANVEKMFGLLKDTLNKGNDQYYIVIDDLDQGWVLNDILFRLIYALIEVAREFQRLKKAKVIIALRSDLIRRVLRSVKSIGYQEEKIRSHVLELIWNKNELEELLELRINELVKRSYTNTHITCNDLIKNFKENKKNISGLDYMLERTMMRPRDIITFFNTCISHAVDQPAINRFIIKLAESDYSHERLHSLIEEWRIDYPGLEKVCRFFSKCKSSFKLLDFPKEKADEFSNLFITQHETNKDEFLYNLIDNYTRDQINSNQLFSSIFSVLYSVGFLGVKIDSHSKMEFAGPGLHKNISQDFNDRSSFQVHKMYWRELGIHDNSS